VVDPLEEIAVNLTIGSCEPGSIRIVDVSKSIGIGPQELALEPEVLDHCGEIRLQWLPLTLGVQGPVAALLGVVNMALGTPPGMKMVSVSHSPEPRGRVW
jgi:hypothetical protein